MAGMTGGMTGMTEEEGENGGLNRGCSRPGSAGVRARKAALTRVTLTLALSRKGRGDPLTALGV